MYLVFAQAGPPTNAARTLPLLLPLPLANHLADQACVRTPVNLVPVVPMCPVFAQAGPPTNAARTLPLLLPLPLANHRAGREYVKTIANRALAANTYRAFAQAELLISVARMLLSRQHVLLPERRGSAKRPTLLALVERTSRASVRVETTSNAVPVGVVLSQLVRSRGAGWERGSSLVK